MASFDDLDLKRLETRAPDLDALIVLESRSHRADATDAFLKRYRVKSGRRAGSSLKFCYIARGDADFYPRLGPTKEWDTAAGQAILEAAGGTVTRLSGATLTYGKADVAYLNPHFIAWAAAPSRRKRLLSRSSSGKLGHTLVTLFLNTPFALAACWRGHGAGRAGASPASDARA